MAMTVLTKDNFEQEVLRSDELVLVDFWAAWCGPCRMIAPIIEEIDNDGHEGLKVCKVNIDEQVELATKYEVMSIPTLIAFKGGQVHGMTIGVQPKQQILHMLGI